MATRLLRCARNDGLGHGSGRLVGRRPLHELNGLGLGWQRRDAVGGERTLQRAAFGVGQRRLACLAYCLRACLVAAEVGAVDGVVEDDGVKDAQEIVLAAAVCVAIALDQAAA